MKASNFKLQASGKLQAPSSKPNVGLAHRVKPRKRNDGKMPDFGGPLQFCAFCGEPIWMRGRVYRHEKHRVNVKFMAAVFFFPKIQGLPKTAAALSDLQEAIGQIGPIGRI